MKKKLIMLIIGMAQLFNLIFFVTYGYAKEITVYVDGDRVNFPDSKPYINEDNRTMVPIRFISEHLGSNVNWNEKSNAVEINYKNTKIYLEIGKKYALVNNLTISLDTNAVINDNRTMVPLRFIAESHDTIVDWIPETYSVVITSKELLKEQIEVKETISVLQKSLHDRDIEKTMNLFTPEKMEHYRPFFEKYRELMPDMAKPFSEAKLTFVTSDKIINQEIVKSGELALPFDSKVFHIKMIKINNQWFFESF
ncbi:hypothetical protein GTO91_10405 [Heliobacterium undosum]|uniref:Copper amine oxidase-like N-terminal domain-containing protein n=1 Tax=Heliomicrobium undosum TaxID=121734 RepID=A0A845L8S1_9FIRM|nr:copper amine oxidase N-terminal domain-containing protein [Heliomicrobium undosum]MZP30118.1 hypothetical protein [Heliomicrobium undosum]